MGRAGRGSGPGPQSSVSAFTSAQGSPFPPDARLSRVLRWRHTAERGGALGAGAKAEQPGHRPQARPRSPRGPPPR